MIYLKKFERLYGRKECIKMTITITNLYNLVGYKPMKDVRPFIAVQDNDLIIMDSIDQNKPKKSIKALICTATIPAGNKGATDAYGRTIFLVGRKFTKLPKKQQLALVEIEVSKYKDRKNTLKYPLVATNSSDAIASTNLDKTVTADLDAMQKFGFRTVNVAKKKAARILASSEKYSGKYLFKAFKKAQKEEKKAVAAPAAPTVDESPAVEDLHRPSVLGGPEKA